MQKITDFNIGDVVVVSSTPGFIRNRDEYGFFPGDKHVVTAVYPMGDNVTAGSLGIEGFSDGPYENGSYGHLLFEPAPASTDAPTSDERPAPRWVASAVKVGDRVAFRATSSLSDGDSSDIAELCDPHLRPGDLGTVTRVSRDGYNIDADMDSGARITDGWHLSWFDVLDPMPTYDPHRPFVIGDRVQVTAARTIIGSGPGTSSYVGKTGRVSKASDESYVVEFDDPELAGQYHGTWSHAALDLLVPVGMKTDADKVAAIRTELDEVRISVEKARAESAKLTRDLAAAQAERTTLTQAASDERRRLCSQIDDLSNDLRTLSENVTSAEDSSREAWAEVARLTKVVDYAHTLLDSDESSRLLGYSDGTQA